MNEKCLELQKEGSSKAATTGCPYLRRHTQRTFHDHVLAHVQDIEELGSLARRLRACPYYGTRKAARLAELVVMPYSVLLHKHARESMGVRLKGNVVILDEAHNVAETVSALHSGTATLSQVLAAQKQLTAYHNRYQHRLKGKNLFYVNQTLRVVCALGSFLQKAAQSCGETTQTAMHINDFLFRCGIDNVNVFKIERYMQRSRLAQKGRCMNGVSSRMLWYAHHVSLRSVSGPRIRGIQGTPGGAQ